MTVFAPMPSASDNAATVVKPGFFEKHPEAVENILPPGGHELRSRGPSLFVLLRRRNSRNVPSFWARGLLASKGCGTC